MKKLLLLSFAALAAWMPAAAQSQVAGNYSGELYVTDASEIYNDDTKAADDQLLTVAANATAGKVDLTLPNFTYAGLPLGDIFLSTIGLQADGTLVRFAQEAPQRLSLMGGAIVADTEIDGNRSYIKGDSLVAYISVTWLVDLNDPAQNVPIKVLFRGAKQSGSGDSETGSMADYHLTNGTFDGEWVENKPWDSQNGYLVLEGKGFTQPEGWVVSNVSGINGLGATKVASAGTVADGNRSVVLTNTPNPFMASQIVPAYISLGTTWATANASAIIKVTDADGGVFGGVAFKGRPDAIALKYKRSHGTANAGERASVIAYTWRGTFTQENVPGNTSLSKPVTTTMVDRDRNILGLTTATGGNVSKSDDAALIAKAEAYIEGDAAEWTDLLVPFTYNESVEAGTVPEKLNVILSANDYFADRSTIGKDNTLEVDSVRLLYYTTLRSLAVNGMPLDVTQAKDFVIPVPEGQALDPSALQVEAQPTGAGARVMPAFDPTTMTLTLRVEGGDISVCPDNFSLYTIRFAVPDAIGTVATDAPSRARGVYTLSGVRVADSLDSSLPRGIYIVNGKKVVK
ncbi:MAG: calycin-like domain-containing protein [Bacteroidales bacterium]|nr:calycin-like domain-containing protein [Bacteroidales bacterium]